MATGSHSTVGWLKAVEMCARPSTAQWGWVGLPAGAPHDPVAALQSFSLLISIPVLLCCCAAAVTSMCSPMIHPRWPSAAVPAGCGVMARKTLWSTSWRPSEGVTQREWLCSRCTPKEWLLRPCCTHNEWLTSRRCPVPWCCRCRCPVPWCCRCCCLANWPAIPPPTQGVCGEHHQRVVCGGRQPLLRQL